MVRFENIAGFSLSVSVLQGKKCSMRKENRACVATCIAMGNAISATAAALTIDLWLLL